MAEYRLEELAKVSGVSARNIRAYRERGLLDPPRRVGRSALYDDYHLSQLNTISQLLRKGFNSVHIAEFFDSMRKGTDLADILGLQRAVLGAQTEDEAQNRAAVAISADSDEARKLVAYGMADIVGGRVVVADGAAAEILARTPDHLLYVRTLLRFIEAAEESVDQLAEAFVASLIQLYRDRVRPNHLPRPDETEDVQRIVEDYRALGQKVLTSRFDQATQRVIGTSASDYTTEMLVTGAWEHSA